jgi:hypothetical protein
MVMQVVDGWYPRAVRWVALSRRTAVSTEDEGNRMVNKLMAPAKWALALALVLPTTGCLAAAAAAGAGAGIYLTTRGAESMVASTPDQIATHARQVMNDEGIVPDASSMEKGGDKRELKGKKGDLDITIDIERKDPKTTRVEVTARKNLAEWDKAYAQQLLGKIVAKS